MTTVRALHSRAMQLAEMAGVARSAGDYHLAEDYTRQAYKLEAEAASLVPEEESSEPTRSILYRSAASLAYQCSDLREAKRLINKGLSGYPPPKISQELDDLAEQVKYEYRLQERGEALIDRDLQLFLLGQEVGFGLIPYRELVKRIENTARLVMKTAQRLMKREFQKAGRIAASLDYIRMHAAVPEPGSFKIRFRFTEVEETKQLNLFFEIERVIDEVLLGIDYINDAKFEELQSLIPDQKYYDHFVSQVKDMAPDGERITLVGFTSGRSTVGLTRSRNEIQIAPRIDAKTSEDSGTEIVVEGQLDFATQRGRSQIGLTTDAGREYDINVSEGMDDLVQSYWRRLVKVTGITYNGTLIYASDIQGIE